ncbi:hypothetical protein B7463_g6175, partial [Scytalidium lignicola]
MTEGSQPSGASNRVHVSTLPDSLPNSFSQTISPVEMTNLDDGPKESSAESQNANNAGSIPNQDPITSASGPATSPPPDISTMNDEQQQAIVSAGPAINAPAASGAAVSTSKAEPVSTPAGDGPSSTTEETPAIPRRGTIAIEPATDVTPAPPANAPGPVVVITLLLTSGARHPYKIDEKYLTKRNVNVPGVTENGQKDPFSISVYTLKELILREWREEWEPQPSSPSSIRLIYFGRLLDDKTPLHECKFNADAANVVHMTVRPQDVVDEEDASKSKAMGRHGEAGEDTAGCRCVIL